jgi:hypothetical protein
MTRVTTDGAEMRDRCPAVRLSDMSASPEAGLMRASGCEVRLDARHLGVLCLAVADVQ